MSFLIGDGTRGCLKAPSRIIHPPLLFLYPKSLWTPSSSKAHPPRHANRTADRPYCQGPLLAVASTNPPKRRGRSASFGYLSQLWQEWTRSESQTPSRSDKPSRAALSKVFNTCNSLDTRSAPHEDNWHSLHTRNSSTGFLGSTDFQRCRQGSTAAMRRRPGSSSLARPTTMTRTGRRMAHSAAAELTRDECFELVDLKRSDSGHGSFHIAQSPQPTFLDDFSEEGGGLNSPEAMAPPNTDATPTSPITRPVKSDVLESQDIAITHTKSHRPSWTALKEVDGVIHRLRRLVHAGDGGNPVNEGIFALYQRLPSPGVKHLDANTISALLHHLATVELRTEFGRDRFMTVIEDMWTAGVPIKPWHWNSAIAFAGLQKGKSFDEPMRSALTIWRRMEHDAGVQSNSETFNILFISASKARRFELADKIWREMERRGLRPNMATREARITSYGLRGNGAGVRGAYGDLVNNGGVVDTFVINDVILALLRSNEPAAAQQVFERMKQLHQSRFAAAAADAAADRPPTTTTEPTQSGLTRYTPTISAAAARPLAKTMKSTDSGPTSYTSAYPAEWRQSRDMKKRLRRRASAASSDGDEVAHVQSISPIAPNLRTYAILIDFYGRKLGNIHRVLSLLLEMPRYHIQPSFHNLHAIFLSFALHGGKPYSLWTVERLKMVWEIFRNRMNTERRWRRGKLRTWKDEGFEERKRWDAMKFKIAGVALEAWAKCGTPASTAQALKEIRARLEPDQEHLQQLLRLVHSRSPRALGDEDLEMIKNLEVHYRSHRAGFRSRF